MFFPFPMHQLTHVIDQEIHHIVRQAVPGKYWGFHVSRLIGRAGGLFVFAVLSGYVLIAMFLTHVGHAQEAQIQQLADLCAKASIAGGVPAVVGGIISEHLWKLLQPAVRQAAHAIPIIKRN